MREPVFTDTIQIALVVRDIEKTMRTYVHDYGIGPWDVYEFNPGTVRDMHEDGKPVERTWRLALAQVGQRACTTSGLRCRATARRSTSSGSVAAASCSVASTRASTSRTSGRTAISA